MQKTKLDQDISNAMEKWGAFWAFTNARFDEQRKEGVIYVNLLSGLICPKDNTTQLLRDIDQATKDSIQRDKSKNDNEKIIERTLLDYECYYTCDISNAVRHLKSYDITEKEIKKVFDNTREKYSDSF